MILRRRALLMGAMAVLVARPLAAAPRKGLTVAPSPQPLPPLPVTDGDGRAVGLAELAGRPALVNLWASWCLPCVAELPALDRLAASSPEIGVMAISLDLGGAAAAKAAFERMGIRHLPLRIDAERQAASVWSVPVLPTTLLLDGGGREVGRYVGAARWDTEAAPLLSALAKGSPLTRDLAPPPASLSGSGRAPSE